MHRGKPGTDTVVQPGGVVDLNACARDLLEAVARQGRKTAPLKRVAPTPQR